MISVSQSGWTRKRTLNSVYSLQCNVNRWPDFVLPPSGGRLELASKSRAVYSTQRNLSCPITKSRSRRPVPQTLGKRARALHRHARALKWVRNARVHLRLTRSSFHGLARATLRVLQGRLLKNVRARTMHTRGCAARAAHSDLRALAQKRVCATVDLALAPLVGASTCAMRRSHA